MADLPDIWDVLVIGAGPAGAMAARGAAQRGARVLMIDKATFPREKVCGCCLGAAGVRILAEEGISFSTAPPVHAMQMATSGKVAQFNLPRGLVISRGEMDCALATAAENAGVTFKQQMTAASTRDEGEFRTVQIKGGQTLRARVVIGAEGLHGLLTGELRAQRHGRIGAATTVPCYDTTDYAPGIIYMACAPQGYVGIVRMDAGLHLAAAINPAATRAAAGIAPVANHILNSAGLPPISSLENARWLGTVPMTGRPRHIAARRLLLIGDSAGYIEPFTGEGMTWALCGGRAVAAIAAAGAKNWTDDLIPQWERTYHKAVRARQYPCTALAILLRHPVLVRGVVAGLRLMPALSAPVTRWLSGSYNAGDPARKASWATT